MKPQLLLTLLKLLPDGKHSIPLEITINKLGSSAVISLKLNTQKMQKAIDKEPTGLVQLKHEE